MHEEEDVVLEDEAHRPVLDRNVELRLRIVVDHVAEDERAGVGSEQPGQQPEHCALPASALAEEHERLSVLAVEGGVEMERPERHLELRG